MGFITKQIDYLTSKALQPFGYDLIKFPTGILKKRIDLYSKFGVNLILDVGANVGQYSMEMRGIGYKGKIISFEPTLQAYNLLHKNTLKERKWKCVNIGLGDNDEDIEINISSNSFSSSIMEITSVCIESEPNSAFIAKEKVKIRKLDSVFGLYVAEGEKNILLKLDVQGYEHNVLEGAKNSLENICGIQTEMSMIELYKNEMLFNEMIENLRVKGFELCSIEPGFSDPKSGKLLQVDGIFFKSN